MAVAYVSDIEGKDETGTTFTLTLPNVVGSGGDAVLAVVTWRRSNVNMILGGATYGGNAMTLVNTTWGGNGVGIGVFYYLAPAGTADVVFTFNTLEPAGIHGAALVLSGVDQGTPIGTPTVSNGTATGTSTAAATVADDGMVVDVLAKRSDDVGLTIGADQTLRASQFSSGSFYTRVSTQPGTADDVASWSWTNSNDFAHRAIPVNAAAAGPTITDVDTDESITGTQANVVITGTNFLGAQGDGYVRVYDQGASLFVTPTIDSWADTSIQFDMSIGTSTGIRYGSATLRVQNSNDVNDDQAITITAPSGKNYVNLSTLAPGTDTDAFALAQSYTAATPLTLTGGAASISPPRRASFTSSTNESGTNFTIIGLDQFGVADSEVVAGPNNNTVYSDGYWSSITSITPNQTEAVDDIEVGQETLRLETSPDMASGDQLEWSNVVGGAIGDVTVNNDGTYTAAAAVTAFDFRVHNQTEGWGSIATQTVGTDNNAPTITNTTLPDADRTQAYSETLAATGDTPITWSIELGELPDGLSLNSSTGEISGTPTTVETQTFTVGATNSDGFDSQELSLEVLPVAPSITTTTLVGGNVNAAYSQQVSADGDEPFVWDITVGVLPDGLTLDADTGEISGVPTTEESQTFTVRATNDGGNDTQELSITIGAALAGGAGGGRGRGRGRGRGLLSGAGR